MKIFNTAQHYNRPPKYITSSNVRCSCSTGSLNSRMLKKLESTEEDLFVSVRQPILELLHIQNRPIFEDQILWLKTYHEIHENLYTILEI